MLYASMRSKIQTFFNEEERFYRPDLNLKTLSAGFSLATETGSLDHYYLT